MFLFKQSTRGPQHAFCAGLALVGLTAGAMAQTARETAVELSAVTAAAPPRITLSWNSATNVTGLKFWRRVKGATTWGTAITLGNDDVSYEDTTAQEGVAYEYSFQRTRSTGATTAYGSIVAGEQIPLVEQRGKICLLVDASMSTPLAPELALLVSNLTGDGWNVFQHNVARSTVAANSTDPADYAARLAELTSVRSIVQADYNSAPGTDWALLIVGHVAVPYSGIMAPDGHADHSGAWPTDAYYADVNGTWTDTSANNLAQALADQRNRNVPGDGKFDQSSLPSDVEMQTGRVDLSNMPDAPTGVSETELLRQYLVRDHQFRRGLGAYASVQRRALIDDNFGYFYGQAFAASGYRNGIAFFGRNAGQVDDLDWFGTLGTTPVLLAYGCGGGWFTSAGGVGTTADFASRDSKAVFCMLFGSYFGDWDSTNNFLRAPLCGTPDSLGLASVWSGRGYFHLYHMALGEVLGYASRYTVNNNESPSSGGWGWYGYNRYIHQGLLGDPTLRLHTVRPPANVSSASSADGVVLTWHASADASLGYHVYMAPSAAGPFTRLTGGATSTADPAGSPLPCSTLTYTHTGVVPGTSYTYLVKAVKMETSASGSYVNTSVGEMIKVSCRSLVAGGSNGTVTGGGIYLIDTIASISVTPNPGYIFTAWSGDATGADNPLSLLMNANKTITATFEPDMRDNDGDGLTNYQECVVYGTNPNIADTDGDSFLDGYEVVTGKSPLDIADHPALVAEIRTAIEFTFPAAIGKTYRIEGSSDLSVWTTVESAITGNGGQIQRFYSTRNVPQRFLRVEEVSAP